ncbi:MAG: MFS transporter, partial [Actinomycetota bacterium]|nr:MFS transporter [Actinomycetota bacterium]
MTATVPPANVDGSGPGTDSARRLVATLTLTVFLQWTGASSIVPMLPVYIRHLGGSDALAGVVMASFFAAGVVSQYPMGRLADRVGRRPVLLTGLVTYGVASVAFLAPVGPTATIAFRSLQGVGAGAVAVAALAIVSGSVPIARRGRAFASIYGGQLAGMAIGP